jgi:hypothetical protein
MALGDGRADALARSVSGEATERSRSCSGGLPSGCFVHATWSIREALALAERTVNAFCYWPGRAQCGYAASRPGHSVEFRVARHAAALGSGPVDRAGRCRPRGPNPRGGGRIVRWAATRDRAPTGTRSVSQAARNAVRVAVPTSRPEQAGDHDHRRADQREAAANPPHRRGQRDVRPDDVGRRFDTAAGAHEDRHAFELVEGPREPAREAVRQQSAVEPYLLPFCTPDRGAEAGDRLRLGAMPLGN